MTFVMAPNKSSTRCSRRDEGYFSFQALSGQGEMAGGELVIWKDESEVVGSVQLLHLVTQSLLLLFTVLGFYDLCKQHSLLETKHSDAGEGVRPFTSTLEEEGHFDFINNVPHSNK